MKHSSEALESLAAELADRELDWNELDFLDWKEFRRMAPAVVRLETARLNRFAADLEPGGEAYDTVVRARFALRQFADGLGESPRSTLPERTQHLRRALLALSFLMTSCESETLRYAAHRLAYIHDRIKLIY